MKYILMVKILLHANVGISICNDASTKIKSQDINITDSSNGYSFNIGIPISAVCTKESNQYFAAIVRTNIIAIFTITGIAISASGTARVYYI